MEREKRVQKKYKAIFFDWDGTAVKNRRANADEVCSLMKTLLEQGVVLCIISGTTYENIAGGLLHERFTPAMRKNLFLGLARGSHNLGFDDKGELKFLTNPQLPLQTVLAIHDTSYAVHRHLLERYNYPTDIVFGRPNYCKIDILTDANRAEALYMSGHEIDKVKRALSDAGFAGGIMGLMDLAKELGRKQGLAVKVTCDAKYLEVGMSNKADNVDVLLDHVVFARGITIPECCVWGDEFLALEPDLWGSDAFMITKQSQQADFFDVSDVEGVRPPQVKRLGGSVATFLNFLREQISLRERSGAAKETTVP